MGWLLLPRITRIHILAHGFLHFSLFFSDFLLYFLFLFADLFQVRLMHFALGQAKNIGLPVCIIRSTYSCLILMHLSAHVLAITDVAIDWSLDKWLIRVVVIILRLKVIKLNTILANLFAHHLRTTTTPSFSTHSIRTTIRINFVFSKIVTLLANKVEIMWLLKLIITLAVH